LLRLAATLERGSEHPLGHAIVQGALERGLQLTNSASFESLTGRGIRGKVEGREIVAGNERLLRELNIDISILSILIDSHPRNQ
jgi:Cu+-exporting ATPase